MEAEEQHWIHAFEDFLVSPVHGISGKGTRRKADYIERDRNLTELFRTRVERAPLDYLKAISFRMPNPV